MTAEEPPLTPSHWMSEKRAKELIGGALGNELRGVLSKSCAPICWFARGEAPELSRMKNGTATFVHTGETLIGITAAHVVQDFLDDQSEAPQTVMIMNAALPTLDIIDISSELDIATFKIDESVLTKIGKPISPLSVWPPQPPMEGRGILIGGYPRISRLPINTAPAPAVMEWGLMTILGVAGRVSRDQIHWMIDRAHNIEHDTIPELPPNAELGGISGGPVIALLERGPLQYWGLAGIVSQASAQFERVVAKRADYIQSNGKIDRLLI